VLAHEPAVLEGHAVGIGELQVGDGPLDLGGRLARGGEALLEEPGQPHEAGAALAGDRVGGIVGAEELPLVALVVGDQRGDAPRHARMTGERGMLGH
jgi:hypothetical protein